MSVDPSRAGGMTAGWRRRGLVARPATWRVRALTTRPIIDLFGGAMLASRLPFPFRDLWERVLAYGSLRLAWALVLGSAVLDLLVITQTPRRWRWPIALLIFATRPFLADLLMRAAADETIITLRDLWSRQRGDVSTLQ